MGLVANGSATTVVCSVYTQFFIKVLALTIKKEQIQLYTSTLTYKKQVQAGYQEICIKN